MLGDFDGGEDWVGAGEGGEEGGDVGFLVVLGWGCAGKGTVFCASEDEILSCMWGRITLAEGRTESRKGGYRRAYLQGY